MYLVCNSSQLSAIVKEAPKTIESLKDINGFGKKKIEDYGECNLHKPAFKRIVISGNADFSKYDKNKKRKSYKMPKKVKKKRA